MPNKRVICSKCRRPESVCLCDAVHHFELPFEIIIWQDPTEAKHPLSTASLAELSFSPCHRVIGEVFNPQEIFGHAFANALTTEQALLFPTEGQTQDPLTQSQANSVKQLLVLDGTWRKVKRLFYLNPWLGALPRIALNPKQASRYRIRTSPRADGLSTLEAVVEAASWMQNRDFRPALSVLDKMVRLQEGYGHKQK